MQEYLKMLNENQYKAVISLKPKILVMAGAGSGKTKVLTTRIKYLLDIGTNCSDICAFTFTNKAAREMKFRLEQMVKNDDVDAPTISTFHSFCYSFISHPEFFYKLGFTKRPAIIEDSTKSKIIGDILSKYEEDYSNIPFVKAISQIKNKSKVTDVEPKDFIILNTVYHQYQEKLLTSNMIDYDDMIPLFIKLCDDPLFRDLVQTKYVLVDECQDTNQIQYELLKLLSEKYGNLFFVGDSDQLIFSFRSSDIKIINDFQNNCDEIIILNQNYRCNQDILKYANKLIDFNSNRIRKELFSKIETKKHVEYRQFSSTSEEALTVAYSIKTMIETGMNPQNIAVLYRNNNQAYIIEKELNNLKIPYTLYGGKPFFEYKEIKTIIYAYRLLFNPTNEIAFENIYNSIMSIEAFEYGSFIEDYHKQDLDILHFASNYNLNPKFQKLGVKLLNLQEQIKKMSPIDFFMELLQVLLFNKYLKTSNQQKSQYARNMALRDMIHDLKPNELEGSFNQMILDNIKTNPKNTVSLLTIHKAKGLEFEVVFVIGFNEGILPGYNKTGEDLEEERRLAYVAITRAKQQLYLYCSIIHFINGNISKLNPSSFLIEAGIKEANSISFFGNYGYNQ